MVLAFIPMLFVSIGYSELNKADPDCGTTFTWGTRTFGPWVGWMGGWGIVVADILVMASLAQVTGQYFFLLFNAHGIGNNPTSEWVLLIGVLFIALLTYVCYRGIELSARIQRLLLSVEVVVLTLFAVVALVRVAIGKAPSSHLTPSWAWFNPSTDRVLQGRRRTPPHAFHLLGLGHLGGDQRGDRRPEPEPGTGRHHLDGPPPGHLLHRDARCPVFAGVGTKGSDSPTPTTSATCSRDSATPCSAAGDRVRRPHLLILMVLTSAAASTQTTILPTARTTLSMGVYRGIPDAFGRMHKRYLTPTVSTLAMGGISIVLYIAFNHFAGGNLIPDAVTAIGVWIAFYYGLTGFTCAWYYRKVLHAVGGTCG